MFDVVTVVALVLYIVVGVSFVWLVCFGVFDCRFVLLVFSVVC